MPSHPRRSLLYSLALAWLPTVGGAQGADLPATEVASERIDFNRDIRGLLSDRCFQCHGTDARSRKAGLRLDTWEGLTGVRKGRQAVVPKRPDQSALIDRIESANPDHVMPPPDSGLSLSGKEKALLRRWIREGADFAPHWAFVSPVRPPLPRVRGSAWVEQPLDRFVLRSLEQRGLTPSASADRETLIRRVSLDLTGLPPTLAEIDAFLADSREDAYERLVDRLLASPRFGERMAMMWLDLARYADTNGFHHDNVRTAWPYRDWVIRSFRDNLAYDEFLVQQLAGDLLPGATEQQRIATAFCRMHNINDEGGALDAEYRVEAVADRIETIATVGMGLTFTCSRCHDHKYDPIKQDDYYSLFAYFNSVEERGVYSNNFEQSRAYPPRLSFRTAAQRRALLAVGKKLAAVQAEIAAAEPAIVGERSAWLEQFEFARRIAWPEARLVAFESAEGLPMERMKDGSVRVVRKPVAGGKPTEIPATDSHRLSFETDATGLRLLQLDLLADKSFPKGRVGLATNGNAVLSNVRVRAVSKRDPSRSETIPIEHYWADYEQPNGDYDIDNLRGASKLGWALAGHTRPGGRTAIMIAKRPFGFDGGTRIEVDLDYKSIHGQHIAGRARVRFGVAQNIQWGDFATRWGDWFSAGPFRKGMLPKGLEGSTFDRLYAHDFGPESLARLNPRQKFGRVGLAHKPDYVDGEAHPLRGAETVTYMVRTVRTPEARKLTLFLGSDDAIKVFLNGKEVFGNKAMRGVKPDSDRVDIELPAGESVLVLKIVNGGGPGGFFFRAEHSESVADLTPVAYLESAHARPELWSSFVAEWNTATSPTFAKLEARRVALAVEQERIEANSVPVLVMKELNKPRETFVLQRGSYDAPDKKRPVRPRPPTFLGLPLPEGVTNNRLGFARWLTRADHPLTARVHVNRLWQMLFGKGIVRSLENFGQQAPWPSHLELLDWLATSFVDSGWDQKALIRRLVTSATYRQSAKRNAGAAKVDPNNYLLAWFPRRRLAGEMIRDAALFVAGQLVERVGGPSVRPYQPGGLWREVSIGGSSNTQIFKADAGEALYRRSLYTFWKRTSPNPQMTTFDAPTREFCVVQRTPTNTPLQMLVLWNDTQFLEAARGLAERTLRETGSDRDRLTRMFRRCTGRHPSAHEYDVLRRTLAAYVARYRAAPKNASDLLQQGSAGRDQSLDVAVSAAWTMIASTVLALDETLVLD